MALITVGLRKGKKSDNYGWLSPKTTRLDMSVYGERKTTILDNFAAPAKFDRTKLTLLTG